MPELTAEQIQRTIEACRAHLSDIGDTICAALECEIRLGAGEPVPYSAEVVASGFAGPGAGISLVIGEQQGLLLLVPESLPLPAWYRQVGLSENNRLQTFAHELSVRMLPADLQADRYAAIPTDNLQELTGRVQVNPTATMLELSVWPSDAAEGDAPVAKMLVVVPVDAPPGPPAEIAESPTSSNVPSRDELTAVESEAVHSAGSGMESQTPETSDAVLSSDDSADEAKSRNRAEAILSADRALRALRILSVPVTVSVRLAERRVPLGQVAALAPGTLVTFNKSCEELLELFVNNHLYCQGEAVKIGENFGLRIAKVGVTEERKEHVL